MHGRVVCKRECVGEWYVRGSVRSVRESVCCEHRVLVRVVNTKLI